MLATMAVMEVLAMIAMSGGVGYDGGEWRY